MRDDWLPDDWDTATPCRCGCGKYEHPKGKDCLYGGRHPDADCRRYEPADAVLFPEMGSA